MTTKEIRTNLSILADTKNNLLAIDILIEHRKKLEKQREILKKHIEKIDSNIKNSKNI